MTLALNPHDVFEWVWAKDLADAHWESRRARRVRNELLSGPLKENSILELFYALNQWASLTDDEFEREEREYEVAEFIADPSLAVKEGKDRRFHRAGIEAGSPSGGEWRHPSADRFREELKASQKCLYMLLRD